KEILSIAARKPLDEWMKDQYQAILDHMEPYKPKEKVTGPLPAMLSSAEQKQFLAGKEIYGREGFCGTCHQVDGKGLESSGFPPLAGNDWVQGDEERLIKIVLHGLYGPIEVAGIKYAGQVPMTPFGG